MDTYFPVLLIAYLKGLCQVLSKPNRLYFQSFIWASLLIERRKCATRIAEACFFVDKSLSSFERFLNKLGDKLKVYGAYLLALDTILIAKASRKMASVQRWKEHSSNPDRGGYQITHHWAVIALISCFYKISSGQFSVGSFLEGKIPVSMWLPKMAFVQQISGIRQSA